MDQRLKPPEEDRSDNVIELAPFDRRQFGVSGTDFVLAKYRLGKLRIVNLSRTDKHFCRQSAITASFEIGHEPGVVTVDRVYHLVATGRTGIIKRIHTRRQKEGSDWIGIVGASFDENDGLRFILVRINILFFFTLSKFDIQLSIFNIQI